MAQYPAIDPLTRITRLELAAAPAWVVGPITRAHPDYYWSCSVCTTQSTADYDPYPADRHYQFQIRYKEDGGTGPDVAPPVFTKYELADLWTGTQSGNVIDLRPAYCCDSASFGWLGWVAMTGTPSFETESAVVAVRGGTNYVAVLYQDSPNAGDVGDKGWIEGEIVTKGVS